jgi:hypothetical protein
LVVQDIFLAHVRKPELGERFLIKTVELSIERSEVNPAIHNRRRTAHAGEAVGVTGIAAQVPGKRIDDFACLDIDLVQGATVAALRLLVVG